MSEIVLQSVVPILFVRSVSASATFFQEKLGFEMPEFIELIRPAAQNRKKPAGWVKTGPVAKTKMGA